jgi:GH18 family chitinase
MRPRARVLARVLVAALARGAVAATTFTVHGYAPDYRPASAATRACARGVRVLAFSAAPSSSARALEGLDGVWTKTDEDGDCARDLVVGGGGRSDGFRAATRDPDALVTAVTRAVRAHAFDGVSYDWEYPTSERDWMAFGELLRATREALDETDGSRKRLSYAIHPTAPTLEAMVKFDLMKYVDWVHVMAYDSGHPRGHAAMPFVDGLMKHVKREFGDVSKFTVGIPFYARSMRTGEAKTYEEIRRDFASSESLDEDQNVVGDWAFDSVDDVRAKVRSARRMGFGGVMIWELGQDTQDEHSLLRAITDEIATLDARGAVDDEL